MTIHTNAMGISHECGIDCQPQANGMHLMYPAAPTIDAGRYQWDLDRQGMTRRQYRASGQDETRECRVWARDRAERIEREGMDTDGMRYAYQAFGILPMWAIMARAERSGMSR